jgi:hypothetical protein
MNDSIPWEAPSIYGLFLRLPCGDVFIEFFVDESQGPS